VHRYGIGRASAQSRARHSPCPLLTAEHTNIVIEAARLARLRSRPPSQQPRAARSADHSAAIAVSSAAPFIRSSRAFSAPPKRASAAQPIFGADCGALRREWRSYLTIPVAGGGRQTVMADTSRAPTRAHDASHSACARNGAQHMQPQHFGAIGGIVAMVVMVLKRHLNWQFFASKSRRARIRFK
jgi:hypothetical protein